MIKKYIELTKPTIILSNLLSVTGGFLIASKDYINFNLLFKILIMTSLIIASSCVFNNIIDRDIDLLMQRTKNRVLALKLMTIKTAYIYALILFIIGYIILVYIDNLQVIYLINLSFIIYVGIYSLLMKRRSIHSTLVGSISGAIPPCIGYCAVTNHFDICALILLIIFTTWQIPHSYSIAIFRLKDYQSASIPTFPNKKGIILTKKNIICYILIFMISIMLLTLNGYTSYYFLIATESLNTYWLYTVLQKNKNLHNKHFITQWSKKIFLVSIITIIFTNSAIIIDALIQHIN